MTRPVCPPSRATLPQLLEPESKGLPGGDDPPKDGPRCAIAEVLHAGRVFLPQYGHELHVQAERYTCPRCGGRVLSLYLDGAVVLGGFALDDGGPHCLTCAADPIPF